MTTNDGFRGWCIVELMGHVTLAGYVSEQEIAGDKLLRIDVPGTDEHQGFTKLVGTGSLYGVTPVDEATVLAMCDEGQQMPFQAWELQVAFRKFYDRKLAAEMPRIEANVQRRLQADEPGEPDALDEDESW